MEERTAEALNRTTNVNANDTSYSTAMARGVVVGAALTPGSSALASGVIHLTAAANDKSGVNIGNASGAAQHIGRAFFGVDGVARKIVKMLIGVPSVGGSVARLFFEALPDAVPIRVTNTDGQSSTQARYITYNGRNYSSAASFNANPGDTITVRVRGYNSQYSGKVTKNGTRVYTQSSNALGSYTYTVPSSGSVTINLVQKSTTVSKTTYYYGEVTITEAT